MLPKVRGDCLPGGVNEARPCPHSSCRYHLDHEEESCVLDVADNGEHTLEEVANLLKVNREKVRQIEASLLRRLRTFQPLRQCR